ncbi:MAG TPA: winged helix-turn-helix domain-containing protein, partial [Vicinamibacterales bacterium]|nr:winged helix-turn-helix domain-containing protein [Vicinamibacterales bacterium]
MQASDDRSTGVSRFGSFELDRARGELRKKGVRVRLEGQPLQILTMLIARGGEPVSREELREALWPNETFGDFERKLNSAVKRLRAALNDSGYSPRYIERIPKRGYRLLVPVSGGEAREWTTNGFPPQPPVDADATPAEAMPADQSAPAQAALRTLPAGDRPGRKIRLWLIAALGIVVPLTLAAGAYAYGRWSAERTRASIRSIAVLPFEAIGVPATEASAYTAFGLTDAVTTELAKLGGLRVASATSARWSRQAGKSLPEIARLLNVDAVLEGSVTQEGTNVRVTAQLVDAAADANLWADTYTRQANDLLGLQRDIAQAVAREVRLTLAPAKAASSIPMQAIIDPVLERAYLEGRFHASQGTPESWDRARQAFERALVRRPKHAPSHAGLADLYLASETLPPSEALPKARQHAMTALGLDDKLAGTHVTLGLIAFYDWDWDGARRSLERALDLDPTDVRSI